MVKTIVAALRTFGIWQTTTDTGPLATGCSNIVFNNEPAYRLQRLRMLAGYALGRLGAALFRRNTNLYTGAIARMT